MEIHKIWGQKIRTLVDGFKVAGMHIVVWDGRDSYGRRVAAVVQFYTTRIFRELDKWETVSFRAIRMNLKKT